MRQWWSTRREAAASDYGTNSSKFYRREGQLTTVPIKPDMFTLLRCISAVLFFSCCVCVAALALANCNEHVAEANILRPHPLTPSVLCTAPKAREAGMVKHSIFSVPNYNTEFLTFLRASPPF
jgi:hypothetical protein